MRFFPVHQCVFHNLDWYPNKSKSDLFVQALPAVDLSHRTSNLKRCLMEAWWMMYASSIYLIMRFFHVFFYGFCLVTTSNYTSVSQASSPGLSYDLIIDRFEQIYDLQMVNPIAFRPFFTHKLACFGPVCTKCEISIVGGQRQLTPTDSLWISFNMAIPPYSSSQIGVCDGRYAIAGTTSNWTARLAAPSPITRPSAAGKQGPSASPLFSHVALDVGTLIALRTHFKKKTEIVMFKKCGKKWSKHMVSSSPLDWIRQTLRKSRVPGNSVAKNKQTSFNQKVYRSQTGWLAPTTQPLHLSLVLLCLSEKRCFLRAIGYRLNKTDSQRSS